MSGLVHRASALACPSCDLLLAQPSLAPGEVATCTRCGAILARGKGDVAQKTFAYSVASLILLVVATSFPFMEYELAGRSQIARLSTGVTQLYADGYWELALIVLFTSILAPAVLLLSLASITGAMLLRQRFRWMPTLVKLATKLKAWSMLEVFLLAIAVSSIKLSQLANIAEGPSLYAFVGLILTSSLALSSFEPAAVWRYLDGEESR